MKKFLGNIVFLMLMIPTLALNVALALSAFFAAVLLVWSFVGEYDAAGVLVVPASLAVSTMLAFLVGLTVVVYRGYDAFKSDLAACFR